MNSENIIKKIKEISNNKKEYKIKKENFKKYKFKTIKDMQEYYKKLYNKILDEKNIENKENDIYSFINYKKAAKDLELNQYQLSYGHVVHKYEKLRNTKMWKIAKKIKRKLKGA